MEDNVNVVMLDMDLMVHEQITKNNDDSFTIFLNSKLTSEARLIAYEHAMQHIRNKDFDKNNVDEIELDAHN